MLLASLISYIDRNTLALLAPTILRETGLSAQEYGFVISGFSVLYMIGNPVWGRCLDGIGLRLGMTLAVSFWTIASAAHAFVGGFWSLAGARTALGFGEGATFPGALRTVVQTLPPSRRSRGTAIAYSGGSLGAVITPLVITPVAIWWGWRFAFLFTGFVGACWLLLWMFVSRRADVRTVPVQQQHEPLQPLRFRDRRVWGFMSAYALGAMPIGFILYGAAIYLGNVREVSQLTLGKLLWAPPLGWEAGYFFWGWLCDRCVAKGSAGVPLYRTLLGIAAILSLSLAFVTAIPTTAGVMVQLFFSMFVAAAFVILPIAHATAALSARHAGLIAGLGAGSWSAVLALLMPVFGRLFDLGRYQDAFGIAALIPCLGFAGWWISTRSTKEKGACGLTASAATQ
ncbi:MAG: MFS transporter [Bryobacteraceae bacterium]|nr:MFS transporter [Bryobacterales bacterium]NUN01895.1 MFS transporter [Bryobacteraceae bacterium]